MMNDAGQSHHGCAGIVLLAESLVVVEALLVENLVAELTLTSQVWTMFLPLVVDKASMVHCNNRLWCFSGQGQMMFALLRDDTSVHLCSASLQLP